MDLKIDNKTIEKKYEFKIKEIIERFEWCFSNWDTYKISYEADIDYYGESEMDIFVNVTVKNEMFPGWECIYQCRNYNGNVEIEIGEDCWEQLNDMTIWKWSFFENVH